MTTSYLKKAVSKQHTPQSEPLPGTTQVANSAGGFAWAVTNWTRLDRFLILGSEGGSYYATERKLTTENVGAVKACLAEDGMRVVRRVVEVSDAGRAPKNDPALFVLAMAAADQKAEVRSAALAALPKVARTATHLYHFINFAQEFRGWGRGLRKAVQNWYKQHDTGRLALTAIKYKARDGWGHADLHRLSHGKYTGEHNDLVSYMVDGASGKNVRLDADHFKQVQAMEGLFRLGENMDMKYAAKVIADHKLPFEAIPSELRNKPEVQEALLEHMPMAAMVRNLANMTRSGLLAPNSDAAREIMMRLRDFERIKKARLHPVAILTAQMAYKSGNTGRVSYRKVKDAVETESRTWTPVSTVVDALDDAFYGSFEFVEPTNKRWLLGVDVSGSMSTCTVAGINGFTPRMAAAAMAMVTARVEPMHEIYGFAHKFIPLNITPKMRLEQAMKVVDRSDFGGTDCSLPMLHASEKNIPVDVFVVLTDSETWAGHQHPSVALGNYRKQTGIYAKLAVQAFVANGFTIADPNDAGMMDVVGFDTAVPTLLSDFALQ